MGIQTGNGYYHIKILDPRFIENGHVAKSDFIIKYRAIHVICNLAVGVNNIMCL